MRIVFDSSVTDFDRGGTSRYVAALLPALAGIGSPVDQVSMTAEWRWAARLPRAARLLVHDLAWVPRGSVDAARRRGAELYHGAGFKVPPRAPFPTSVTIHDDTPWDNPPTARLYNRAYMRRVLARAAPNLAGAIAPASLTARAVEARLPPLAGRVHVTHWGVDHDVFRPRPAAEVDAVLRGLGVQAPYALLVAPYGPRKNATRMLQALAIARQSTPGLTTVVVGRHDPVSGPDPLPVVRIGRVDDSDLAALYSGAGLLLYASLKEGFGLPVLEAMACGCPVVGSRGTVLEEVGAEAMVVADPLSVDDIAGACRPLLEDRGERQKAADLGVARAAGFTWAETARRTVRAWEAMTPT